VSKKFVSPSESFQRGGALKGRCRGRRGDRQHGGKGVTERFHCRWGVKTLEVQIGVGVGGENFKKFKGMEREHRLGKIVGGGRVQRCLVTGEGQDKL